MPGDGFQLFDNTVERFVADGQEGARITLKALAFEGLSKLWQNWGGAKFDHVAIYRGVHRF